MICVSARHGQGDHEGGRRQGAHHHVQRRHRRRRAPAASTDGPAVFYRGAICCQPPLLPTGPPSPRARRTFVSLPPGMPWRFTPSQRQLRVTPGQSTLAFYTAENLSKARLRHMRQRAGHDQPPSRCGPRRPLRASSPRFPCSPSLSLSLSPSYSARPLARHPGGDHGRLRVQRDPHEGRRLLPQDPVLLLRGAEAAPRGAARHARLLLHRPGVRDRPQDERHRRDQAVLYLLQGEAAVPRFRGSPASLRGIQINPLHLVCSIDLPPTPADAPAPARCRRSRTASSTLLWRRPLPRASRGQRCPPPGPP